MPAKLTTAHFIAQALAIHNGFYAYPKTDYKSYYGKLVITCPVHGDFEQTAVNHLSGRGCSACGGSKKLTLRDFIVKASLTHSGKYLYEKSVYLNSDTPLTITCPEHGDFEQIPYNHLAGKGCRLCGGSAPSDTETFIEKAEKVHGNVYRYEKIKYINASGKVKITCRVHGDFIQEAKSHLLGRGCPKCVKRNLTTDAFIAKAKAVHGNRYAYPEVEYLDSKTKVKLECPTHGIFEQAPNGHLNGAGCPQCGSERGPSYHEVELSAFVSALIATKLSDRTLIPPQEIDCLIPSKHLGVEFCGLYFHSDKFRHDSYHLDKTKAANRQGLHLIHVFSDEWEENPHIVKSIIKNQLGFTETVIYARKTELKELSAQEMRDFLTANHLQGSASAEARLGLYYDDELVLAASFSKSRKVLGEMPDNWYELVRLCPKINTITVGGFSKLLKHFILRFSPAGIKTFCDRRYFTGGGYEAVGFTKLRESPANYFYVKRKKRYSRFMFQKHKLADKLAVFDPLLSERQNMLNNGYLRIYDCGNSVFVMPLSA